MKNKLHTLPIATIVVWLVILLAWVCMGGCAAKKKLVEVHDTLVVSRVDTTNIYITRYKTDTLRMETERVITLRESGDTLRVNVFRDRWRTVYQLDTIDRYKVKADTLKAHTTEKVVKEKRNNVVVYIIVFVIGFLIGFIIGKRIFS